PASCSYWSSMWTTTEPRAGSRSLFILPASKRWPTNCPSIIKRKTHEQYDHYRLSDSLPLPRSRQPPLPGNRPRTETSDAGTGAGATRLSPAGPGPADRPAGQGRRTDELRGGGRAWPRDAGASKSNYESLEFGARPPGSHPFPAA